MANGRGIALSGTDNLGNQRIDIGDSLGEQERDVGRYGCSFEVFSPMRMGDHDWRPRSGLEAELPCLLCARVEHGQPCGPDLGPSRTACFGPQVAQQQQVDDVTKTVVDRDRRVVRVGNRVEFLRDLESHCDPDEGVGVGQTEPAQRRRLDRFGVNADAGLVW